MFEKFILRYGAASLGQAIFRAGIRTLLIQFIIFFILIVPFFSTPIGEKIYLMYQDTKLHKSIYCQYVDWFGAEGFSKLKFIVQCKIIK